MRILILPLKRHPYFGKVEMIDIGSTEFYINEPKLSLKDFERYSTILFDKWDREVEHTLKLPDYSISLEVEEGSIKGWGKIGAPLVALYFGIGEYGSFITGLDVIQQQAASVHKTLAEKAVSPFQKNTDIKTTHHRGTLNKLKKIFERVQKREITAEEAMVEAEGLLGDEANSCPEFMEQLESSLANAPKFHQQIPFPEEIYVSEPNLVRAHTKLSKKKPGPIFPTEHFRVEIWRESRRQKKKIKVTEK